MSVPASGPASIALRRTSAALLAGAALAGLLAGCAAPAAAPEPAPDGQARLHPVGDPGAWLSPGYASGSVEVYATTGEVCGVADGVSIEEVRGPGWEPRVQARRFPDGQILWEIPGSGCSEGAVRDGSVLIGSQIEEPGTWSFVDAATGEAASGDSAQGFRLDPSYASVRLLAEVDGIRVLLADQRELIGIDADGERWSRSIGARSEVTVLDDGFVGVRDMGAKRVEVVDGRTGERRSTRSRIDPLGFTWASDGFVLRENQSDPEYAFFDLDGEEVDRTIGSSQYGFVPAPRSGVTFPVSDHLRAGGVVGVGSDGVPALFEGDHAKDFTRRGEIRELPGDSIIGLHAVSSDGSLLLFDSTDGEGVVLIDAAGEEVLQWDTPYDRLRVESGYLLLGNGATTQVLLPTT